MSTPSPSPDDQAAPWPGAGVTTLECAMATDQVLTMLLGQLDAARIDLLAVIDHSGDAREVGVVMPDTKLVVFGNAAVGTPLMLENPLVALDLPTKLLLWTDGAGRSLVSYNDATFLVDRYELSDAHRDALLRVETLARALAAS